MRNLGGKKLLQGVPQHLHYMCDVLWCAKNGPLRPKGEAPQKSGGNLTLTSTVRDVTWMRANGVHLCKWTVTLILVTLSHLNKCSNELTTWSSALQHLEVLAGFPLKAAKFAISDFWERHLYECHRVALSQVITHTGVYILQSWI